LIIVYLINLIVHCEVFIVMQIWRNVDFHSCYMKHTKFQFIRKDRHATSFFGYILHFIFKRPKVYLDKPESTVVQSNRNVIAQVLHTHTVYIYINKYVISYACIRRTTHIEVKPYIGWGRLKRSFTSNRRTAWKPNTSIPFKGSVFSRTVIS